MEVYNEKDELIGYTDREAAMSDLWLDAQGYCFPLKLRRVYDPKGDLLRFEQTVMAYTNGTPVTALAGWRPIGHHWPSCRQRLVAAMAPQIPAKCERCGDGECTEGWIKTHTGQSVGDDSKDVVWRSPLPAAKNVEEAVRTILKYIGEDPDRAGLKDTPERFLRAWHTEWGRGYKENPDELIKLFHEPGQTFDEMVMVRRIKMWSFCEHHIAPFFGFVDIAYIPNPLKGIIGISKLARVLDHFSRRLQVQERIGVQVADFLMEKAGCVGVGIIIRATHTCMCSRGVNQQEAETVTSTLRGALFHKPEARAEFLHLARG